MAFADNFSVYVHTDDLESLFECLQLFCSRTQFLVQQHNCHMYQGNQPDVDGQTKVVEFLGYFKSEPFFCEQNSKKMMVKAAKESHLFFKR